MVMPGTPSLKSAPFFGETATTPGAPAPGIINIVGGHHRGKYAEGIARQPEGEGIASQHEDVSTTTFTQTASTLAADPAIRTIKNAYLDLAPEVLGNHCPEGECVLEGTAICEPCSSSTAMDAM
jgi:hypothetical protein